MQFKQGTGVYSAKGDQVATLERVVMTPGNKTVTHIVVREGLLLTEDRVVPIGRVASATDDRITLDDRVKDIKDFPLFEERYYVQATPEDVGVDYASGAIRPLFGYPPVGTLGLDLLPLAEPEVERNIPANTVPLKQGASVVTSDDEHVGNVERIFTNPGNAQASHLVISKGLLLKERKLIPMTWVSRIGEQEVRLAVGSQLLDRLPPYQEEARSGS